MDKRIKNDLRIVARVINPSEETFNQLIAAWERYMRDVETDKQYDVFCNIIKERIDSGSISITAPKEG